ncbi:phage major capsid protein [Youngiibacter multivorans]|uniref:HK97 family phage major capsid protein n=1 Tax=Youngiibacter multivorans TaxID=937251 RepID=A0ABS4G962_9CLOT|nr:phage major capsid protein [Youngiibacter multivorans]MBP1920957.1 HK97 family phage major capsid protein [Youngiibacter multivorans]
MKGVNSMTYAEAKQKLKDFQDIPDEKLNSMSLEELRTLNNEVDEVRKIIKREEAKGAEILQTREKALNEGVVIRTFGINGTNTMTGGTKAMEDTNKELEVRSFQRYLAGEYNLMNDTEKRALDMSGSAAVVPLEIANKLLTSDKYSDLLHRATVISNGAPGNIQIPIASATAAAWKLENSEVDGSEVAYEAAPTLTYLSLGGYELFRHMRVSAAAASMATGSFQNMMLELLQGEVIEALEKSFIDGSGTGQPKGLANLTWDATNQKLTASSITPIAPADIAGALALLPNKYARNAVIIANTDTVFNTMGLFKGTTEFAYNLADAAEKFMGHQIIINEHVADDVIYIVDPSQLYVRFAMPIQVEANRASGFTSASIDLRALTVVDAVWNPKACARVGLGAQG